MNRWSNVRVAALAIRLAGMIERCRLPRGGVMARRTLTIEMIGRFVVAVATLAIGLPGMIKRRRFPCGGRVTRRTLTLVVIRRTPVARLAIDETGVVHLGIAPRCRRVAL